MQYRIIVEFDSEDNNFPGNTPDAVVEIIERMLPYMVDNVEVEMVKPNLIKMPEQIN